MLSSLLLAASVGFVQGTTVKPKVPAPPVSAPSPRPPATLYDFYLRSIFCEKKESAVLRDKIYGFVALVSLDPAAPKILGNIRFDAGKMGKMQAVTFGPKEAINKIALPGKEVHRWVFLLVMEGDRVPSTELPQVFLDSIRAKLPEFAGKGLTPTTMSLRTRVEIRKRMRDQRKWLRNDDDVVGTYSFFIPDDSIEKTKTQAADFNVHAIGASNAFMFPGAYMLTLTLEKTRQP